MCLTISGKVVELKGKNAFVDVKGKRCRVRINPSISVSEGDKVIIFKNIILDKV